MCFQSVACASGEAPPAADLLAAAALCVALPVTVLAGNRWPMKGASPFSGRRHDAGFHSEYIWRRSRAGKDRCGRYVLVDKQRGRLNLFGRKPACGAKGANTAGDGNALFDGQMPDRWAFAYNDMPRPVVRVGDAVYGLDMDYFQDDDLCPAHLVNDTLPDSFAMQIPRSQRAEKYQTLLGTEGDWTLECGVDITSTRGVVKNAEYGAHAG